MPPRSRLLALGCLLAVVAAYLTGCAADDRADRRAGDPVTEDDARVLAELLYRNGERGGADFVATAPYGEKALLTLVGEVDFTAGTGRAQAVTEHADGRGEEVRTLFFTGDALWFGDVPGLADRLAAAGEPGAAYLRRPVGGGDAAPALVDVLTQMVLNLSADSPDDPQAVLRRDYTWEGRRTVNGRSATVYAFGSGESVAVDGAEELLLRYRTRLEGPGVEVTVTLAHHGRRQVDLPGDTETADAGDHPQIAAGLGL